MWPWTDDRPGRAGRFRADVQLHPRGDRQLRRRCRPRLLYWGSSGKAVGRAPVGGAAANNAFIPSAVSPTNTGLRRRGQLPVRVLGQLGATDFIGRANLNGSGSNPGLIAGPTDPCPPAAAPANKITFTGTKYNKKKGTAKITAKVPGLGQVSLSSSPAAPASTAASKVKPVDPHGEAAQFGLPVKPKGKTAKTLMKKGKAKVTVFVAYDPAARRGEREEARQKLVKNLKKKKKKK